MCQKTRIYHCAYGANIAGRRDDEGLFLAQANRYGVKIFFNIKIHVLYRIYDVEPGNPGQDNQPQNQRNTRQILR